MEIDFDSEDLDLLNHSSIKIEIHDSRYTDNTKYAKHQANIPQPSSDGLFALSDLSSGNSSSKYVSPCIQFLRATRAIVILWYIIDW